MSTISSPSLHDQYNAEMDSLDDYLPMVDELEREIRADLERSQSLDSVNLDHLEGLLGMYDTALEKMEEIVEKVQKFAGVLLEKSLKQESQTIASSVKKLQGRIIAIKTGAFLEFQDYYLSFYINFLTQSLLENSKLFASELASSSALDLSDFRTQSFLESSEFLPLESASSSALDLSGLSNSLPVSQDGSVQGEQPALSDLDDFSNGEGNCGQLIMSAGDIPHDNPVEYSSEEEEKSGGQLIISAGSLPMKKGGFSSLIAGAALIAESDEGRLERSEGEASEGSTQGSVHEAIKLYNNGARVLHNLAQEVKSIGNRIEKRIAVLRMHSYPETLVDFYKELESYRAELKFEYTSVHFHAVEKQLVDAGFEGYKNAYNYLFNKYKITVLNVLRGPLKEFRELYFTPVQDEGKEENWLVLGGDLQDQFYGDMKLLEEVFLEEKIGAQKTIVEIQNWCALGEVFSEQIEEIQLPDEATLNTEERKFTEKFTKIREAQPKIKELLDHLEEYSLSKESTELYQNKLLEMQDLADRVKKALSELSIHKKRVLGLIQRQGN